MTELLPSRARSKRNVAAIVLFIAVYIGVLVVVLAPREMIAVQSGSAFYATDN